MHSTMRSVKLDHDNPLDLHEQVAGEIRRAVTDALTFRDADPVAHAGAFTIGDELLGPGQP